MCESQVTRLVSNSIKTIIAMITIISTRNGTNTIAAISSVLNLPPLPLAMELKNKPIMFFPSVEIKNY